MVFLLIVLSVVLIAIIAIQVGKVAELATKIRGEEEMQEVVNKRQGVYMLVFLAAFLIIAIYSGAAYKNYYLGFGPLSPASKHGKAIDDMFQWTLIITGIVFFATQILLFYFAYRYRGTRKGKAQFLPHNNTVELVWTIIPAITMTFLVIAGLDAWNEVMADVKDGDSYLEIEATGYQFAWVLRYPGMDGQLGEKNFRLIDGSNPVGQNWKDEKNVDDFHSDELWLPKGKKVRVRITSRDVLHNFYLPHFRVKMDAVPGMPTYFVFTPTKTTEEFRQQLKKYPEYQKKVDPKDPESPMLWEAFDYELACAELCGNAHFSMRKTVKVVEEEEWLAWQAKQQSYYLSTIRFKPEDPNKDKLFDFEIKARKQEFQDSLNAGLARANKTVRFKYVNFETGSAKLTPLSKYELDNLVETMKKKASMQVLLAGHTDNVGKSEENLSLSQKRAQIVAEYLSSKGISASRLQSKGYGDAQPLVANDSDANREKNRRTEFRVVAQ